MPRIKQDYTAEELEELRRKPKDAEAVGFVEVFTRAPGANDPKLRLVDLDEEGIWGEVIYPSLGDVGVLDPRPEARARGRQGAQRLGDRVPAHVAAVRVRGDAAAARRRRHRRRDPPRAPTSASRSSFMTTGQPFDMPPYHHDAVAPGVGGRRGDRHGARLPHRHRAAHARRVDRRVLPRPRRRGAQLRRDHLRRPALHDPADRVGRARPSPRPPGARVGGRRDVGTVPRRPHGRGLPPARVRHPAEAVEAAERVPLRARCTRRSSTTGRRCRPTPRWAGRT